MKPTNPSRGQGFFAVRRAPLSHRETLGIRGERPVGWVSAPARIERVLSPAILWGRTSWRARVGRATPPGEPKSAQRIRGRALAFGRTGNRGCRAVRVLGARDGVIQGGTSKVRPDGVPEIPGNWPDVAGTDGDPAPTRSLRTRRRARQGMVSAWFRPPVARDERAVGHAPAWIFVKPNNSSNFRTAPDTMGAWPCKSGHAHESRHPTCREHAERQWKQGMESGERASWRGTPRTRGCPTARLRRRTRYRVATNRRVEVGPRCRVGWHRPCQEPRWARSASPLAS